MGVSHCYQAQMSLVPDDLVSKFEESGWYHGRRVAVDAGVPADHPAHAVLAEFGGLRLMRFYGDYEVCEVEFLYVADKDDHPRLWEAALGTQLVGIAEHHNSHGELWMSDRGIVFGNSMIHPAFWYLGNTFHEAVENLMAGRPGRPMLLDSEASATHHGREYTRGDAEVLHTLSPELRR